jgi:hypothetical protein
MPTSTRITSRSSKGAEVADLTQAPGEAAVELRVWKKSAESRLGDRRGPEDAHLGVE